MGVWDSHVVLCYLVSPETPMAQPCVALLEVVRAVSNRDNENMRSCGLGLCSGIGLLLSLLVVPVPNVPR